MPQTTTQILLPQTVSSRVTTNATGVGLIQLTNPGAGYVTPPNVTISGTGTGATAVAILNSSGGILTIQTTYPGQGYTQVPTIIIDPPPPGGTQAVAVAFLNAIVYGQPQPAASYYLANQPLQTITWMYNNVTAIITLQASLVSQPGAGDWFNVSITNANSETITSWQNVTGNFVWLRVVVQNFTQGTIQYIQATY
jgi:hypothetical protein